MLPPWNGSIFFILKLACGSWWWHTPSQTAMPLHRPTVTKLAEVWDIFFHQGFSIRLRGFSFLFVCLLILLCPWLIALICQVIFRRRGPNILASQAQDFYVFINFPTLSHRNLLLFFSSFFSCPAAYGDPGPGIRSKPKFRPTPQLQCWIALTHGTGWGSNPWPGALEMPPIPLRHRGNSRNSLYF